MKCTVASCKKKARVDILIESVKGTNPRKLKFVETWLEKCWDHYLDFENEARHSKMFRIIAAQQRN